MKGVPKSANNYPKVPIISIDPKATQKYHLLYTTKLLNSNHKPLSKSGYNHHSTRMSETTSNFRTQPNLRTSHSTRSVFKKYKKFRIKTEPSPRKKQIVNYKSVNYLKDLHVLPDKTVRLRYMREKDERILQKFKNKMNH